MLWLTAAGLWLVSEACAFSRFQPALNRLIQTWAVFGLVYPAAYIYLDNALALTVFNTYSPAVPADVPDPVPLALASG